ncbi:hypothetical protein [Burkholderia sp. Bp9143]|uniref:hypothetical protein n=1 Tax=Burkholderia sp. Bp9143 TaxID=2184574 RepID=UPI000F5A9A70|nr:hypothetical protein [Burkholderia sp. Bp9143]
MMKTTTHGADIRRTREARGMSTSDLSEQPAALPRDLHQLPANRAAPASLKIRDGDPATLDDARGTQEIYLDSLDY